ncbi:hypothetical protein ACU8V3_11105 [Cobetia marina]
MGKKETLLSLYAEDAILVPTVADDVRENRQQRQAYFDGFLANEALACELGEYSPRVSRKLGTVVIGGHYTFEYRVADETVTIRPAFCSPSRRSSASGRSPAITPRDWRDDPALTASRPRCVLHLS